MEKKMNSKNIVFGTVGLIAISLAFYILAGQPFPTCFYILLWPIAILIDMGYDRIF